MAKVLKRNEVLPERKWNVEDILDEKDIQKMVDDVQQGCQQLSLFQGKLNKQNALECLLLQSRTLLIMEKLYVYARLRSDEDKSNTKYSEMSEQFSMLYTTLCSTTSFITPSFSAMKKEDLSEMRNNPKFAYYTMFLDEIIREKKHLLSAKEEKIMAELSSFSGDFQTIFSLFDNVDVPFGEVNFDGEKTKLSHGLYSVFMQNEDRSVRKEAYETLYKAYISMGDTLSAVYAGSVKKDCFSAKVRKYSSSLEKELFSDNIPVKVYNNLISSVHKYIPLLHKYMDYRRKRLRLDKLAMYDLYVPLESGIEKMTEYDKAFEMVCEGLSPLGKDYIELLRQAKKDGWIDVEETENKRSGAYSWGVYGTHPYVLLNHQGTVHDVFTIAHELGHAIHTYFSNKNQCFEKADYSIFVAEIASTVNEVLMLKYMLKEASGEERKYLLTYYSDMIRTTLFRQTMFSEFEKFAHDQVEKGEPLSKEKMCSYYADLNKRYYGNSVETDTNISYEWIRIPHFYTSFYVYKYATGITSAINIVNMILKDVSKVENYKKFLSAGSSMYPMEILAIMGIDLTKTEPYTVAMKEFESTLKELISLK